LTASERYEPHCAAVLIAQSIVDRADVEKQELPCSSSVGGPEQRVRRQIDDHQ
jgi:hypothetical protein